VDFSFFVGDRDSVKADFSSIQTMIGGIFRILDTDGADIREAISREQLLRIEVRVRALGLLTRLFNLRANFRLSLALKAWETLFATFDKGKSGALLARDSSSHSLKDRDKDVFKGHQSAFKKLEVVMFNINCISPEDLGMDTYKEGAFDKDYCVTVLLNLCLFKNTKLTSLATQVLMRHMSQRMRVIDDLAKTQVLVYPAAVKVYEETTFALKRLTSLKKYLSTDDPAAYKEAMDLLKRMTDYMQVTVDNPKHIVQKNQRILLNRELDEPIVDLLRLNLERDTTQRDGGEIEADPALNIERRDLFQACYDFLKHLCAYGHTRAQEKMFKFLMPFSDHMGIQGLNVAGVLQEIVRDNPTLCTQVQEAFFRHFIFSILTYGRKPRWLSFFEVFVSIDGNPSKRNQDMLLRLLLEEKDTIIDLTCDYTDSPFLIKSDERSGKKRLDLLIVCDHKRKVASLAKYHQVSVNLLAKCCTGKNPANKAKVAALVSFDVVLDNILDCHLKDDGASALEGGEVNYDAVCYVRQCWTQLMEDSFLSSFDSHSVREMQAASRVWLPAVDFQGTPITGAVALMAQWRDTLAKLTGRLRKVDDEEAAHRIGLCGSDPERDFEDDEGKDLGTHYLYVKTILSALSLLFARADLSLHLGGATESALCTQIYDEICKLQTEIVRLKLEGSNTIVLLVTTMTNRDIKGTQVLPDPLSEAEASADEALGVEEKFQKGWTLFKSRLADQLVGKGGYLPKLHLKNEIRDLSRLLGSCKSPANDDLKSLKLFMHLLCEKSCEGFVRRDGVRIVRAILYMHPDKHGKGKQNSEYERLFTNEDPSATGRDDFRAFQVEVARGGAVQAVVACLSSNNHETQLGALQLGCTLLAGGNCVVQDLFYKQLSPASSQSFFSKLKEIFGDSVNAIKESKRRAKQVEAERQASLKAGISSTRAPSTDMDDNNISGAMMTEVMKFMRRSCIGQHQDLQNVLRVQRVNRESFNFYQEAVQYISVLEPDIKSAIQTGDQQVTEAAIRGFLMLGDAMKGPNYDNQQALATSGILDLADRIMNKIKLDAHVPGARPPKTKKNQISDEGVEMPVTATVIYDRNKTRCRLKMAVLECLHSFLEGVVDNSIPMQMLSTVNWMAYASQMNDCYNMRSRKDVVPIDGEGENMKTEGISYYFLFKFLEKYQEGCEGTPLTAALDSAPGAARYFEARKGYLEITRDGRLERVFYLLPEPCINGGPLDKAYDALFDTEREDPDKKTKEFLDNMICLVDKEKFLDVIRASIFAFTINRWESIMMLCFYWGGLLHLVLILGAYAPYHGLLVTESGGEGSSKAHYAAIAKDSTCEQDNCWNRFFVEVVETFVDEIAKYMCYVYAGICALRYFSFIWAHVPLIILDGLTADEEAAEVDAKAGNTFGEHAEDDEPERLFVEHLDPEGEGRGGSNEEEEEEEEALASKKGPGVFTKWRLVLGSTFFVYESVFVAMGALAVIFDDPLFTAFFWCDLTFFPGSQTVVNAIKFKAGEMMNTLVLGIAIMYIWMVIGILLFRENHADNNGQALCVNMFQCTLSYFMIALRGDGVADLMDDLTIPLNIVDSVLPIGEPNERFFLPLLLWDFTYNWLFIYILLAIITGIVIDAFGGLREEKEAAEGDLKAVCFVCNLERFRVDQDGIGFDKHVKIEHNPRWYLFFLIYIDGKSDALLNGQEKYVKSRVWPATGNPSCEWIPRECTDSIKVEGEEDPNAEVYQRMDAMEGDIGEVKTALSRIEEMLSKIVPKDDDTPAERSAA